MDSPTPPTTVEKIRKGLKTLERNAQTLIANLEASRKQVLQIEADLTATRGAIQFARQIIAEEPAE